MEWGSDGVGVRTLAKSAEKRKEWGKAQEAPIKNGISPRRDGTKAQRGERRAEGRR